MKLQEGESILYQAKPAPAILGLWLFTKCLPVVLTGSVLSVILGTGLAISRPSSSGSSPFSLAATLAAVVCVVGPLLLIAGLIYCNYLRLTYVYYITNQRCVFHGGILRRVERSVPYHKITDVEMSQNIFERVMGISSLGIFTPGTASSSPSTRWPQAEIAFIGLKDNEAPAAIVNDQLRKFKATGD